MYMYVHHKCQCFSNAQSLNRSVRYDRNATLSAKNFLRSFIKSSHHTIRLKIDPRKNVAVRAHHFSHRSHSLIRHSFEKVGAAVLNLFSISYIHCGCFSPLHVAGQQHETTLKTACGLIHSFSGLRCWQVVYLACLLDRRWYV